MSHKIKLVQTINKRLKTKAGKGLKPLLKAQSRRAVKAGLNNLHIGVFKSMKIDKAINKELRGK